MAVVHPSGWREMQAIGSAQREIETLAVLAEQLPDNFTVFHGVHWTRVQNGFSAYGEVDFVVVAPNGRVLLIEQKSGFLLETDGGLVKSYGEQKKVVASQIARSVEALQARYAIGKLKHRMTLDFILYCPDHKVVHPHIAGLDPRLIVDAHRRNQLADIIQSVLKAGEDDATEKQAVCRFFEGVLELTPEIGAISSDVERIYSRVSGGLATWARQIEMSPFRFRVIGTAGSGKTQLAMAVFSDAIREGRRPLYVCYNQPLADHIAQIVPPGGTVANYHQIGAKIRLANGDPPDFNKLGVFEEIEAVLDAHTPAEADQYEDVIIDEGQDFAESWAANLLRFLRPKGRIWWLEDPMQNLYSRHPAQLADWVSIRSDINYRSPKHILDCLNRLLPLERPIEVGSPLSGYDVDIVSYSTNAELLSQTVSAVTRCIGLGFKRSQIAVVTYRGRQNSLLAPYDKLGPYSLRAPTGRYDEQNNSIFTDGDLLTDTVLRFKGRAAPCVVFTEIDFDVLDDKAVRRLFVGATRATMKLTLVVSESAAKMLLDRL